MLLKRLFTSNARIKLLSVFLSNVNEEFFIRELTRNLDEQINSVRRELDNLKKLGILKAKTRNRKKFYTVNKDFFLLEELRSIFVKSKLSENSISDEIAKMGDIKLLLLSGLFVKNSEDAVDMLIVGEIDRQKLANYLNNELKTERPVKFAVMNESDYNFRLNLKDRFLSEILNNKQNQILIKKI